jgi:uncharacterized protein (DUF433 family)
MTFSEAIWQDSERVSGAICFRATRLPVHVLFDYLKAGQTTQEFLDDYPDPTRKQVETILAACQRLIDEGSPEILAA